MNRYQLKVDKRCLYIHDANAGVDLDMEQLVSLLHDRQEKINQVHQLVGLIADVKEELKFFDKIPQAKKRVKILREKIETIFSSKNS